MKDPIFPALNFALSRHKIYKNQLYVYFFNGYTAKWADLNEDKKINIVSQRNLWVYIISPT